MDIQEVHMKSCCPAVVSAREQVKSLPVHQGEVDFLSFFLLLSIRRI